MGKVEDMKYAKDRARALPCFTEPTHITPLDGGITNVNLVVTDGSAKFVVRLGEDIPEHGVMRWNELSLSQAAHALGVAPRVIYNEPGILVLEMIEACTYTEENVRDPKNLSRIIDVIAKMHRGMGKYLVTPVLAFWPYQVNQTYMTRLESDGSAHLSKLPELRAAQQKLIAATGPVDLVICHNDLLAGNILDDGDRLWLIDWEYGGYNTPLFDLAGLAGNNGLSEMQESAMLEQYFNAPSDRHWRPYQAMKCASLLRETLWSMISEIHSKIDFNYATYTEENLDRLHLALANFNKL